MLRRAVLLEVDHAKAVNPPGMDHTHGADHLGGLSAKHPAGNGQGIYANVQEGTSPHGRVIDALNVFRHLSNEGAMEVVHLSHHAALYERPYPAPNATADQLWQSWLVSTRVTLVSAYLYAFTLHQTMLLIHFGNASQLAHHTHTDNSRCGCIYSAPNHSADPRWQC